MFKIPDKAIKEGNFFKINELIMQSVVNIFLVLRQKMRVVVQYFPKRSLHFLVFQMPFMTPSCLQNHYHLGDL